jgi:hypothetical protein
MKIPVRDTIEVKSAPHGKGLVGRTEYGKCPIRDMHLCVVRIPIRIYRSIHEVKAILIFTTAILTSKLSEQAVYKGQFDEHGYAEIAVLSIPIRVTVRKTV